MNKTVVVAAAAGALTAVALSMAQDARADEASYIDQVYSHGTPITSATLSLGHQVCSDISSFGVDGITGDVANADRAGVSAHDASVIIVSAVWELCPSNLPVLHAWLYPTSQA